MRTFLSRVVVCIKAYFLLPAIVTKSDNFVTHFGRDKFIARNKDFFTRDNLIFLSNITLT